MGDSSIDRSQVGRPPYPVKDWRKEPTREDEDLRIRIEMNRCGPEPRIAKDAEHEAKLAQARALLAPLSPRDLDAVSRMLAQLPAARLLERCQALTMENAEPVNKWPGQKQETVMPKSGMPLREQLALSSLLETMRQFGADLPPKDK